MFLALFSYTILCEFHYFKDIDAPDPELAVKAANHSSATEDIDSYRSKISKPSWVQYLLIVWIFSFICEEIRNVRALDHWSSTGHSANFDLEFKFLGNDADTWNTRIFYYFQDLWNYFDMAGCTLFLVGMTLRFVAVITNEDVFTAAR